MHTFAPQPMYNAMESTAFAMRRVALHRRLAGRDGKTMCDGNKRVLVVDDDDGIVEPVRLGLEERGYEVLVAHDGTEALMHVERDAPDLVLLDIVMPRRNGLAVLDRLSGQTQNCPRIIMMTGNAEDKHRTYAHDRGVTAFIAKPFDVTALLDQVDSVMAVPAD
ncbi:MAG: response regulator [Planctomycetaceae bacterium]